MPTTAAPATAAARIAPVLRVGISACLLGREVRYDGGHKRDPWLVGGLGPFVEWVPLCPEMEIGLGVPRPTIRLEEGPRGIRLVEPRSGTDLTDRMAAWSSAKVEALARLDLDGFVLKKNSPSCGMERVKIWRSGGSGNRRQGRGLFAEALLARLPLLPVEEEGRLEDADLRENFVIRLFARARLRDLFRGRWTVGDLVAHHAREKYLLLAHRPAAYTALGRLVAGAKKRPRAEVAAEYQRGTMEGLARPATRKGHANVLEHMAGFFRDRLDPADRAEVRGAIDDFRRGLSPLLVPLTLVRHHARRRGIPWLEEQVYLRPHPRELLLRNHP